MSAALAIDQIDCFYGDVKALHGLSLEVRRGEVHCLLGRNGAGKTTTLKAIMGLVRVRSGKIVKDGVQLSNLPAHKVPKAGIGYVPQGRRLFADLTVMENLQIGLMTRDKGQSTVDDVLRLFPVLREKLKQRSGTLSGGEQQMLAMARALCLEPDILLLDEPTEGLQPSMIARLREAIVALRDRGVATLLVEQRVDAALSVADRVSFIESGRNRETVDAFRLRDDRSLVHRYVGLG